MRIAIRVKNAVQFSLGFRTLAAIAIVFETKAQKAYSMCAQFLYVHADYMLYLRFYHPSGTHWPSFNELYGASPFCMTSILFTSLMQSVIALSGHGVIVTNRMPVFISYVLNRTMNVL